MFESYYDMMYKMMKSLDSTNDDIKDMRRDFQTLGKREIDIQHRLYRCRST